MLQILTKDMSPESEGLILNRPWMSVKANSTELHQRAFVIFWADWPTDGARLLAFFFFHFLCLKLKILTAAWVEILQAFSISDEISGFSEVSHMFTRVSLHCLAYEHGITSGKCFKHVSAVIQEKFIHKQSVKIMTLVLLRDKLHLILS